MNPKFVVSHLDQQMGPFSEQELKMKWAAGEILPIDYVYDETKEDWILLADRFTWAAGKGALTEEAGPPPVRDEHIMKRTPPPPRPVTELTPASPVVREMTLTGPVNIGAEFTASSFNTAITVAPINKAETPVTSGQGAQVRMVNGVGEIDLNPMKPGPVELVLQNSSAPAPLKMTEPLKINIKAAEPVAIEWTCPTQQTVGQDVEVQLRAIDGRGMTCTHYSDLFLINIRGPIAQDVSVKMQDGQAVVLLNHIKAENWELTLQYAGTRKLKLPDGRKLEWQPGAATRLVLDGPGEYLAGDPMKVQIKAVDAYGNLAKTFQGTVVLEVKAS